MPGPLGIDALLPLLAALRAPTTVPDDVSPEEAVLHLSHGLVGAFDVEIRKVHLFDERDLYLKSARGVGRRWLVKPRTTFTA